MVIKRPQQERSQSTFSAILEASAQILTRDGEKGLTARKLAERAGVSIGSLYQYFKGTPSILHELVRAQIRRDLKIIIDGVQEMNGPFWEKELEALFRKVIQEHLQTAKIRSIFIEKAFSMKTFDIVIEEVHQTSEALFQKLKSAGAIRADLDPEIPVFILSRSIFAVVMSLVLNPPKTPEQQEKYASELAKMVVSYLHVT
jgi:AcrR family transcriptional regulator